MKTIAFDESQFRLVPVEPTEEMRLAFWLEWKTVHSQGDGQLFPSYLAMLDAAPAPPEATQAAQDALDAARWRFARRHWGRLMESYEPTSEGALDRIARIMIANDQQVRDGLAWDVDPESLDAAIDSAIAAEN